METPKEPPDNDLNGTIKVSTQGLSDDETASATLYTVSHANAILEFDLSCNGSPCPVTCLSKANFELIEGRLKVTNGQGFQTNGTLTVESGTVIDAVTGATFSFSGSCGG